MGTKVINCRLPEKTVDELNVLVKRFNLTKSSIIRQALIFFVEMLKNANQILVPDFKVNPSKLAINRRHNCTFIRFPNKMVLVLSCISSGSIGPNPMDKLKVSGFLLGKLTTRAALMDIISINAWPISIAATLCVKMDPTGSEIIRGIKTEMVRADLDPLILTVDTEENFDTEQTGIGVTIIGLTYEEDLKIGKSQIGDVIIAVGKPCVGQEVLEAKSSKEIADLKDIISFLKPDYVHEIMPVDTEGILSKANLLAHSIGKNINFYENIKFDLEKSAGPSTSVLVTVEKNKVEEFLKYLFKPYSLIGEIV
ncbi:MAG: ribbon-helix-helix protein, CopG family [Asgard group archaeon]